MKKLKLLLLILAFAGCETTQLELTSDPVALSPDQADPTFFLNAIQEDFARFVHGLGEVGAELTRIQYMSGRNYANVYDPTNFDNDWQLAYQQILQDIKLMNVLAEEAGLKFHIGMGKVIEAYIMVTLVDYFGDVPYSEALQADSDEPVLNPAADSGSQIYTAALDLLTQAAADFNASAPPPSVDLFYNGNPEKWVKAANSLRMKIYLNQGDTAAFNSVSNYISDNADDFQFHWGNSEAQPVTRHPYFIRGYTSTGGGIYQSNWLMNTMNVGYGGIKDPRSPYYFYRQVDVVPGFGSAPDEEVLECGLFDPPIHYQQNNQTFCGLDSGYWGRDHGNDNGIPPDGFLRTLPGIYPAGGIYDDASFNPSGLNEGVNNGLAGAGITPLMLASWVDFMKAEVSGSKEDILSGMDKSIEKATSLGGGALSNKDSYIAAFSDAYDQASDKANLRAVQYWIALFGNGIDAYNAYRRTGLPNTLQLNIEPNPGTFPTIMWYPGNYSTTNSNATQRSNLTEKPFWVSGNFNLR